MVWHQSLQTVCMHHSVHQKWRVLDLHGLCLVSVESIEHYVNIQQFTKIYGYVVYSIYGLL